MSGLYVYKEQSIGQFDGTFYQSITGLGSKGWGGLSEGCKSVLDGDIRPAVADDFDTFKLSGRERYGYGN